MRRDGEEGRRQRGYLASILHAAQRTGLFVRVAPGQFPETLILEEDKEALLLKR